jgi:hypothetical protein
MMSGVKILMNWDIKPGRDQEYFEFVIREWVPRSTKLGLEMTGAWYTVYSRDTEAPQIMAEGIADNLASMRTILNSEDWKSLHEQLLEYVVNYSQKVVRVTGGFQI